MAELVPWVSLRVRSDAGFDRRRRQDPEALGAIAFDPALDPGEAGSDPGGVPSGETGKTNATGKDEATDQDASGDSNSGAVDGTKGSE